MEFKEKIDKFYIEGQSNKWSALILGLDKQFGFKRQFNSIKDGEQVYIDLTKLNNGDRIQISADDKKTMYIFINGNLYNEVNFKKINKNIDYIIYYELLLHLNYFINEYRAGVKIDLKNIMNIGDQKFIIEQVKKRLLDNRDNLNNIFYYLSDCINDYFIMEFDHYESIDFYNVKKIFKYKRIS